MSRIEKTTCQIERIMILSVIICIAIAKAFRINVLGSYFTRRECLLYPTLFVMLSNYCNMLKSTVINTRNIKIYLNLLRIVKTNIESHNYSVLQLFQLKSLLKLLF